MQIEYSKNAIAQAHQQMDRVTLRGGAELVDVGTAGQDTCPRHGARYVVRRGTNRCPIGRKKQVNCR